MSSVSISVEDGEEFLFQKELKMLTNNAELKSTDREQSGNNHVRIQNKTSMADLPEYIASTPMFNTTPSLRRRKSLVKAPTAEFGALPEQQQYE